MTCRLRRQEPSLTSRNEKVLASRRDLIQPAISIFASALAERAYLISVIIKPDGVAGDHLHLSRSATHLKPDFAFGSFCYRRSFPSNRSASASSFCRCSAPRARSPACGSAFLPRECFGANALAGLHAAFDD